MRLAWRIAALTVAGGLLAAARGAVAAPGDWWNDDWRYRIPVRISAPPSDQTSWVAQARFMIPDGCHADGADVRVVDAAGHPCPMKLMYYEPALYGVVAFELARGTTAYWIYLGNPAPPAAPTTDWEPRAGVFLETRRIPADAAAANWDQFKRLYTASDYSFGAGYMPKIHDGFNPFGEPDHYLSAYTAWFKAPVAGRYTFATVSDDASFVWVDDKLVCQWPGRHEVHGGVRGQHNGTIELTAGPHLLRYYHADFGDSQTTLAAWLPPGEKAPRVLEAPDYLPLFEAMPGPLEVRDAPVAPDFTYRQEHFLALDGETFTYYTFFNRSTARGARIAEAVWTFGDGTAYRGDQAPKMFFAAGDQTLTLTVKDEFGNSASTTRPFRVHAIDRVGRPDDGVLLKGFGELARAANLAGMGERETRAAVLLLRRSGFLQDAAKVQRDLIERDWTTRKQADVPAILDLAELMATTLNRPREAADLLQNQLPRLAENDPRRAGLQLKLGRILLDRLDDADGALAMFKSAQRAPGDGAPEQRRALAIALGDACRRLGRVDEANAAYRAAEKIPLPNPGKPFDISSYALTTEAYIRTGEWEEAQKSIDEWTRLFPSERTVGYASVLQARIYAGRGDRTRAVGELETFLKSQPAGVFAQMALEELGDLYGQSGAAEQARDCYTKVLDQFQDPVVQARIRQKLARLGK